MTVDQSMSDSMLDSMVTNASLSSTGSAANIFNYGTMTSPESPAKPVTPSQHQQPHTTQ